MLYFLFFIFYSGEVQGKGFGDVLVVSVNGYNLKKATGKKASIMRETISRKKNKLLRSGSLKVGDIVKFPGIPQLKEAIEFEEDAKFTLINDEYFKKISEDIATLGLIFIFKPIFLF